MYRVSKYLNEIKNVKVRPDKSAYEKAFGVELYHWFDTYEEAKAFIIGRTESKINSLKEEIKKLEKKLPKLKKMQEKTKPQTT